MIILHHRRLSDHFSKISLTPFHQAYLPEQVALGRLGTLPRCLRPPSPPLPDHRLSIFMFDILCLKITFLCFLLVSIFPLFLHNPCWENQLFERILFLFLILQLQLPHQFYLYYHLQLPPAPHALLDLCPRGLRSHRPGIILSATWAIVRGSIGVNKF